MRLKRIFPLLLVCFTVNQIALAANDINLKQSDRTHQILGGIGDAAKVTNSAGATVTAITDITVTGAATLIDAANANRTALSCTNTSASVAVRWGGADVTAAKGQRIPANGSAEIRNQGAIYMISEGADVTMSCTQESK
jgi:hypothetical protein